MASEKVGMNIDELQVDSDTDSQIDSEDEAQFDSNRVPDDGDAGETSSTRKKSSEKLAKIELALAANKELDEKLEKLEIVLTARLKECREKLKEVQATASTSNEKNEVFRYITCGRPYFKDKQGFPAPDNNDAKMAKSQMYDFSLVVSVPGWTVRDKSQFITMIHKMSKDIKKNELHAKIAKLKRNDKTKSKKVEKEIAAIRKEIDKVNNLSLSEVALPIDQEYDWDMVASKLNRRHTAQEYQSFWKLFFHPSINKNSWSKAEHASLQKIACQNGYQDWDDIASKLNTGRTGYQCFVYYRTNMTNSFTGKKWTNEEVTYLKRLIEFFKEDVYIPWGKIAAAMENRTKIQIYNKYLRLIEKRKGRFLPEEDAVILNCVERFGRNFRKMTHYLPGRSMVQIRTRYQVLSKMRVSTVWSVEDDKKLVQLMSNQESNMNFAAVAHHFPGRNRTKIRTRYLTLMKWMKRYPHLDLEHAPRRGARRLNHGQASGNLNDAVENLKKSLITTVQKKPRKKKISNDTPHKELNDAVVVHLVNSLVKEKEIESRKPPPEDHFVISPNQIVSYADLNITNLRKNIIFLNARLDKPTYMNSHYRELYPTLGESSRDVSLVKVKSYSRKNTNQTMVVRDIPNVWGTPTLTVRGPRMLNSRGQRNYVLPPQLSTIIGARAIMTYMMENTQYTESINLPVIARRNIILRDLLEQLYERFYILFTWPMILSNEGPVDTTEAVVPRVNTVFARPPTLPTAPEVTINTRCIKKFKNKHVSETIDLEEEEAMNTDIAVEENLDTSDEKIEKLLCDD